jgi:hypothetical protein
MVLYQLMKVTRPNYRKRVAQSKGWRFGGTIVQRFSWTEKRPGVKKLDKK